MTLICKIDYLVVVHSGVLQVWALANRNKCYGCDILTVSSKVEEVLGGARGEFNDDASETAVGPILTDSIHDQWRWDPQQFPKRLR